MQAARRRVLVAFAVSVSCPVLAPAQAQPPDLQLPGKMSTKMDILPSVRVAQQDGDIVGKDNRALQAAVEYIAALGGGVVEIGPGTWEMRDSLHLRSGVTVRGTPGKTLLRKSAAVVSPLEIDGDFGEEQITVEDAQGFEVGYGVVIFDERATAFHTTVARITGKRGNTLRIDKPLMADCLISRKAQAATCFPVVSGYDVEGVRLEHLEIAGNREKNIYLTGCRGGGIFLYRCHGAVVRECAVWRYHGDGISFQQSNDVTVENCSSDENTALGLHPGSGSQRPTIRGCMARGNGQDGLFLCWRVRRGLFEDNLLSGNGRFGISIGHKDTDNLIQRNRVLGNKSSGVFFRKELEGMAAHRNRLKENIIEDNGESGIRIRGSTQDLVFEGNVIRDTRTGDEQTQRTGILIEERVGSLELEGNRIEARTAIDDRRALGEPAAQQ